MTMALRSGRRRILQGLGASLLGLPFLKSLPSQAAPASGPRRLIVFFSGNTPIGSDYWRPQGNGASFPLTSLRPGMKALEGLRDKLTIIGGLEMKSREAEVFGAGHVGTGHLLTGRTVIPYGKENPDFWGGGISVDQFVAKRLGSSALTLAAMAGGTNGNSRLSYLGPSQPVHPITDPAQAFDKLFGDLGGDDPAKEAIRAQKKSVLDRAAKDLEGVMPRISAADRPKLESHLDALRGLEKALDKAGSATCDAPELGEYVNAGANSNYPTTARRQMDILAQAIACDLTQVASIQCGSSGSGNLTPQWADEGLNISMNEHELAHAYDQAPTAAIIAAREGLEAFYFRLFAYLCEQLDAIPEGEGSVLDNSLVVYTKNLGYKHASKDMLFMIAGSGGGALETGRYLDFPGRAHNDLLASLCHLMGQDDVSTFGDPNFCAGPLPL